MQIYGPFRVSTNQPVSSANRVQPQKPPETLAKPTATPVDQLELSSNTSEVNRLQNTAELTNGGEIRIERVAELRRQIANGSYETPEKLDVALDRLLDQFA